MPASHKTEEPVKYIETYAALDGEDLTTSRALDWLLKNPDAFAEGSRAPIKWCFTTVRNTLREDLPADKELLDDVRKLADGIHGVTKRWAHAHPGKSGVKTLRTRSLQLINEFLAWLSDPDSWQPKPGRPRQARNGSPAPAPNPPKRLESPGLIHIHLNEERRFSYSAPADLTLADVERIRFNLMTRASDFDPSQMSYGASSR
jgi:hypothetical protein